MLDARYWGRTMGYFNTVYRGGEAGLGSNKCDSDIWERCVRGSEILEMIYLKRDGEKRS